MLSATTASSTITAWDVWLPISAEIVRIDFGDKSLQAVNDGDEETSVRRVVIIAGEASIPVSRDEFTTSTTSMAPQ